MENDEEDEYEEVYAYAEFPTFNNLNYITRVDKIEIDVKSLFEEFPSCEIEGAKFHGYQQLSLGTRLFVKDLSNSDESTAYPENNIIGITNAIIDFQLCEIPLPDDSQLPPPIITTYPKKKRKPKLKRTRKSEIQDEIDEELYYDMTNEPTEGQILMVPDYGMNES